jgi:hypothetical protein
MSAATEEAMATLAHAIRDLEASTITPEQFWTGLAEQEAAKLAADVRLPPSRELHFAVTYSLNACIKKLSAYRDQAPPMPSATNMGSRRSRRR